MKQFILVIVGVCMTLLTFENCVMKNPHDSIAPGIWRATLKLEGKGFDKKFKAKDRSEQLKDEITGGELPFNFEVKYENGNEVYLEIINGEERIKVDDITIGRNRRTGTDTLTIAFPHYESRIEAIYEENVMEGKWIVETKENYKIPFVAFHGRDYRFSTLRKQPKIDLSGKWEVHFSPDTEDEYPAIGEFKLEGNHLTGTFQTETGDFRFLEGTMQANKVYLSCFDGSHAFLYEAKVLDDDTMIGAFWSGSHYKTTWTAKRNPNFQLTNADSLTYLKPGYDKVSFKFPNAKGESISLEDDQYKGKVRLVQILGTWCPNCADETAFLSEYYNASSKESLEVIGLAFEKHRDKDKSFQAIERFKSKFNVNYEVLLANGSSSKKEASDLLPMLNKIISYPTLIFIDKKGKVRKIHTGFSGPATSQYANYKKSFKAFVDQLISE